MKDEKNDCIFDDGDCLVGSTGDGREAAVISLTQ